MIKKLIPIACLAISLFSCNNDDDSGSSNNNDIDTPTISGEFTSVEEGKTALENNAIEALEKIEAFNNDSALEQIIELAEYINKNSTDDGNEEVVIEETLENLTNLSNKSLEIAQFNTVQNDLVTNTLEDDFDEATGVHEWSDAEGDFIKTGDSDDIIYTIAYNGKNATFSVSDFEATEYVDGEELPTLMNSTLVIDGETVFSQTFSSSVDAGKYLPNSYTAEIEIGTLSLESAMTNSGNNSITETVTFKIDGNTIMYLGSKSTGNFNDIDTNGDVTESYVEDIFNTSELTLSFLNASVTLDSETPSEYTSDEDYTIDEQIDFLNENIDIQLSVDNKLVADGEFYLYTYINEYYYYDGIEYVLMEEEDEDINIRFVFPDDSTADFETYFNDDFSSVESKLESVFDLFSASTEETGL